jgi:hypothetical protein
LSPLPGSSSNSTIEGVSGKNRITTRCGENDFLLHVAPGGAMLNMDTGKTGQGEDEN